jgi:hypothetical protein
MVSPEFVVRRDNIAVESPQKETASLRRRDCPARATHPSVANYVIVKQVGFGKWPQWSKRW